MVLIKAPEWVCCRSSPLTFRTSLLTSTDYRSIGIRTPANNGPIGPGYNSSPVKNLTSIDLRCNLLGDSQAADTIVVAPGDTISFEWYVYIYTHSLFFSFLDETSKLNRYLGATRVDLIQTTSLPIHTTVGVHAPECIHITII